MSSVLNCGWKSVKLCGLRPMGVLGPLHRFSSSVDEDQPDLATELSNALSREEHRNKTSSEYEAKKKLVSKIFKIADIPTERYLTLSTTRDNSERITVKFDCQQMVSVDDYDFDEELEESEAEAEGEDSPEVLGGFPEGDALNGSPFELTVEDRDGHKMIIDCTVGHAAGTLGLVSVTHIPHGRPHREDQYLKVRIGHLEESVQYAFYDYLQERRVDDNLAAFLAQHYRIKRRSEHVNWLKRLHAFVSS